MKKNLMILAAAAAAFGLLAITGCDKTVCEAEPSTGTVSINKVWVAAVESNGETGKYYFNITDTEFEIGVMSADVESYLPYFENANADNSCISSGKFEISERSDDETSGSFTILDGDRPEIFNYSALTENSVTLTKPGETEEDKDFVFECTAVSDITFYTYDEISEVQATAVAVPAGLQKQWTVTVSDAEVGDTDYLFDFTASEGKLIRLGMMNEMYAQMLPGLGLSDFNAETDFIASGDITPNRITENGTAAGTIVATDGGNDRLTIIEYSNLTETSVTLTIDEVPYNCTATSGKNILELM